ncbi:hypothetical protein [Sporolactobacillus terrae]|uniref:hypothetical protein n=1 Tax=Sporolactobacillus terrae TaxID=269673 RepID=UPI000491A531|nr:hypothetical protein [Sporolactobacillus terrae]
MQEVILTADQLKEKLDYWQKRLRLQDWLIDLKITRKRDMEFDSQGECNYNLLKKMAVIRIVDSVDYDACAAFPQDMEWCLVHELLHLHFAPLHVERDDEAEEQAVDLISNALVTVARETNVE